jgi:hypothetical protein
MRECSKQQCGRGVEEPLILCAEHATEVNSSAIKWTIPRRFGNLTNEDKWREGLRETFRTGHGGEGWDG